MVYRKIQSNNPRYSGVDLLMNDINEIEVLTDEKFINKVFFECGILGGNTFAADDEWSESVIEALIAGVSSDVFADKESRLALDWKNLERIWAELLTAIQDIIPELERISEVVSDSFEPQSYEEMRNV